MERKLVSEEELINYLNYELSKYKEYKDCKFDKIEKLAEPDKMGSNWSRAEVWCSGVPAKITQEVAHRIISEAKERFNLKK